MPWWESVPVSDTTTDEQAESSPIRGSRSRYSTVEYLQEDSSPQGQSRSYEDMMSYKRLYLLLAKNLRHRPYGHESHHQYR